MSESSRSITVLFYIISRVNTDCCTFERYRTVDFWSVFFFFTKYCFCCSNNPICHLSDLVNQTFAIQELTGAESRECAICAEHAGWDKVKTDADQVRWYAFFVVRLLNKMFSTYSRRVLAAYRKFRWLQWIGTVFDFAKTTVRCSLSNNSLL